MHRALIDSCCLSGEKLTTNTHENDCHLRKAHEIVISMHSCGGCEMSRFRISTLVRLMHTSEVNPPFLAFLTLFLPVS